MEKSDLTPKPLPPLTDVQIRRLHIEQASLTMAVLQVLLESFKGNEPGIVGAANRGIRSGNKIVSICTGEPEADTPGVG